MTTSAIGPMMLGVSSVGFYSMAFAVILIELRKKMAFGLAIFVSTIVSYLLSVSLTSIPFFFLIRWKQKQMEEQEEEIPIEEQKLLKD